MDKQTEQQELQDIIATREDGFGLQFKAARDEQNLTVEEVSRKLHLDKKIILALEKEDYTQLPVATFVCGYIRNYAKFLKIQPEPLIEYYKNVTNDDNFAPELKIIKEKNLPGSSKFSMVISAIAAPIMTLLVIIVLGAGGWQLWLYVSDNYLNKSDDDMSVEMLGESSLSRSAEVMTNDAETLLLPDIGDAYNDEAPVIEEKQAIKKEVEPEPVEVNLQAEGSLADGSLAEESPSSLADSQALEAVNSVDVSPVLEQPVEVTPIINNQLILEFSGPSWVKIKSADGKVLASGLKKASKVLHLDGKLPYHVFLGDARVVKVSLNGQIFDHAKYINEKNVARFKVK